jgi:hypothetical protein
MLKLGVIIPFVLPSDTGSDERGTGGAKESLVFIEASSRCSDAVIEEPRELFPRFMVIWYPTNYVSILPPRIVPLFPRTSHLTCDFRVRSNDQSPPQQDSLFRLNRSRLSSPPSLRLRHPSH